MAQGVGERRTGVGDGSCVTRRDDHGAVVGDVHRQTVAAVVQMEAHGLLWPATLRRRHVEQFDDVGDGDGVPGDGH